MTWVEGVVLRRQRGESIQRLANFVLEQDGVVRIVETWPNGRRLAEAISDEGIVSPDGERLSIKDGLVFLENLHNGYRGKEAQASKLLSMMDDMAYGDYDRFAPAPRIRLVDLADESVLFDGVAERIEIGSKPDCDVTLDPIDKMGGVYAVLTWREGALWVGPGEGQVSGLLEGRNLASGDPSQSDAVSPGDVLTFGELECRIDFAGYRSVGIPAVILKLVEPRQEHLCRLRQVRIVIGRSSTCVATINDVNNVSEEHVVLTCRDGALWAHDNGSAQGSFIDDEPLSSEPVRVKRNARLRLGEHALIEVFRGRKPGTPTVTYEFLFVYDTETREFPKRYWIKPSPPEPQVAPPEDEDLLDGFVPEEEAQAKQKELATAYPEPRYVTSLMNSATWEAVDAGFYGLYFL